MCTVLSDFPPCSHSVSIIPDLSPSHRQAAVEAYASALRAIFICQAAINFITFLCCLPIEENPLPCVFLVLLLAALTKCSRTINNGHAYSCSGSPEEQEEQYRRMREEQQNSSASGA